MKLFYSLSVVLLASSTLTPCLRAQADAPCAAIAPGAHAQSNPAQLDAVLKQMDAASKRFTSAQADFQWDYYEKIVRDTTTQTGSIFFQRSGTSTDMGAIILNPDAKAKQKVQKFLEYKGGNVRMFDPGVDQITVLKEGANQAEIESFLTLGFGGSGSDLQRAWNITDLGPESMNDGQPVKAEKLYLVGKSADSQKNFSHVTIWIDPARAVSLKQVFCTPTGNYRMATYSHIKLNGSLDKGKFAIKPGKNTTTINH